MEEESTDELVTRGRGTDTFPKEKEEDPVDENSELLGEVVEVEGEHNEVAKTVTRAVYTELVKEQALSTTDSV